MFNIPMSTTGAMDSSSLLSLNGGGNTTNVNNMQSNVNNMQSNVNNMQSNVNNMQNNVNNMQNNVNNMQNNVMNTPINPKQRPQGNGVHLKKGQKVALQASNGGQLTDIKVCLGWDILNMSCDLDASAFMLGADGRVIGDDWFVFYGQPSSPDGSVNHSGDSTNGAGAGDDEIISINLNTVNPNVKKITFVVTINEALERGLNFSMVSNAYVRVLDSNTGIELNKFQLTDYYANVTAMVVGEVYNHNGQWKFNAVGDGVAKDLAGLCAMYGVNVAD